MSISIKLEKNQNLKAIFERLKGLSKIDDEGNIVYHDAIDHGHLEWMLHSITDFGQSLSNSSEKKILREALKVLVIKNRFEKKLFIEQLDLALKKHNKAKEKEVHLLGTISIVGFPFRKLEIGGAQINIHGKNFPKKYQSHRNEILNRRGLEKDTDYYTKISVVKKSKNDDDAFKECIEIFEVFRAFTCFLINKSMVISYGGKREAINIVHSGEVFTLHKENGENWNKSNFWFNPDYTEKKTFFLERKNKLIAKNFLKKKSTSFNRCLPNHQREIKRALNIFVSAFDEKSRHLCFLKAWPALEVLANTDQNDLLIKRTKSIFKAKDFVKQDLECLRLYRNQLVHKGSHDLDPQIALYRLQMYVKQLINFNLSYAGFFRNIEDSVFFLDNFNLNLSLLNTRLSILRKAIDIKQKHD